MANINTGHLLLLTACYTIYVHSVPVFRDCGGRLTDAKGVIKSPNFPKEFPTPIQCEWVIYNPQTRNTAIYLTQFYLKGFVSVWQFEHYSNQREYINPRQLATLNANSEIQHIVSNKPYTVIRLAVSEINDINVRVLDHIVDVYGFNITYEFLDRSSTNLKRTCSINLCSYLGDCYANGDFSAYRCHCFEGYQGDICQYGEHCDPAKGINQCKNGGECRYFYGTNVNICNCTKGFTGHMCEVPLSDYLPDACAYLGCGQTCIDGMFGYKQCACYKDFRLNPDNRTCSHIDRNRIIVTMQPTDSYLQSISGSGNDVLFTESQIESVRQDIELNLKEYNVHTMTNFTFIGSSSSNPRTMEFHFIIETSEQSKMATFEKTLFSRGLVGDIPFYNTSLSIKSIPVLYLMEVVTTEEGQHDSFWGDDYISYTIEGKFLTISCIVRGSENTSFRWFKDGMLIDMGVAVRKGFQTIINSKLDGTLRSVLYYGNVKASDRGEYTCEARDFGIAQNKSDLVDVITTPMVDIDPMADYVPYGGSIRIRCLSFDQDALQYEWYVNNLLIKRGRSDMIPETLQPAGSQLYVRRLLKRAIFTCKVTNAAGAQNVTADIYVQPANHVNDTCHQQWYKSILWAEMAGGHYRKERCPAEAGGFVTRKCRCRNGGQGRVCSWDEPNFSMCQSVSLVQIYDEMEILRNGYRSSSLQHVFDQLFQYAASPDNRMYSGDVEIAANVLLKILQHLVKSPSLYYGGSKISFVNVVYLLDQLLTAISNATVEEKKAVSFGDNMIGILDALSSNLTSYLDFSPDTEILSDNIDVEFGSSSSHRVTLLRQNGERALVPDTNAYPVVLFSLRNLIDLFPMKIQRDHNLRSVSEMLDVSMFPSDSFVTDNLIGRISIPLLSSVNVRDYSTFHCLSLKKDSRFIKHAWKNDSCHFVSHDNSYITCQCSLPVMLQVVGIQQNETIVFPAVQNNFELLLVGAAVAISGLALILIILVVACRRLPGEESVIYVNFICVLIALNCVVIVCLYHWKTEIICTIGRYALFFLYSAALSFLLLVSVHQFISPSKAGGLVSKYLMFGWGCPLILTSFFVVASQMFDKSDSHSFMCWLRRSQWTFYYFAIEVAIITFVMFVFSVLSVKSKTIKADIATAANRRQLLCRCIKTGVLLMLVAMDAFLSMDLTPDPASIQLILLITCRIAIVISLFVSRIIMDTQVVKLFRCSSPKSDNSTENSDEAEQSCKGCCSYFNHPTREQEKANKYYAEVNRAKYTAERKRHLSSLLGSSAAHELPLNNTEANSATVSCAETKIVDKPSQTTGPLLFIRANGSKEVAFVSERVPILNQNDTRIIGREVERLGVSAPNHSVRKNGYNRVNLSGQNSRSEPQEELTALIHSTADKEVQQHKQLL
eukprot:XP_019930050.1 PREDICTED: uncharacterized protein LOC105346195 isoform X2 [Crassostrea gigas]